MPEPSAGTESLSPDRVQLRAPWFSRRPASELLCNGSMQNKAVRFGSLEPAHVTLARQSLLPLVVVLTLAACVLALLSAAPTVATASADAQSPPQQAPPRRHPARQCHVD